MTQGPHLPGGSRTSQALGGADPRHRRGLETLPEPRDIYGEGLEVDPVRRRLRVAIGPGLSADSNGKLQLNQTAVSVTGSLSDGSAVTSLIAALKSLGFNITDNTTA